MGAIAVHHTKVVDKPWDGPANRARLRNDGDAAYYSKAHAWVDPNADENTKSAYKFIHHMVDGDGNIGAANVKACITGIGVLNGGRGGASIPAADREGVYRHLAAHLRDAGIEPPELKAMPDQGIDRRAFASTFEVREEESGPVLVGTPAVFNQLSVPIWGFRERIVPGAFQDSLERGDDVVALWNHDANFVLGRRSAGTLDLWEEEDGLHMRNVPPDAQWARDLLVSIRRGDVKQMSFGFYIEDDHWVEEDDVLIHEVRRAKLVDVSPVTFPAYPQTSVYVRSVAEALRSLRDPGGQGPGRGEDLRQGLETMRRQLRVREILWLEE